MAGLKELIDMESIEDQPTSSVPKNKSDYTEPYNPSMARGLARISAELRLHEPVLLIKLMKS